ncbi:Mor transcription activator family protein [Citrobacter freundii]
MKKISFNTLLSLAPHKDITAVNKFILSSCFTCNSRKLVSYIQKLGYVSYQEEACNHIALIKKQFEQVQEKFGNEIETDFFCDVAGTAFFQDFMLIYNKDSFYQDIMSFNPDFNYTGNIKHLRERAVAAVRYKEFQHPGDGLTYIMDALDTALKKAGINPHEEFSGTTRLIVATMSILNDIGGMQFYLPKGEVLKKITNRTHIYTDSFTMGTQQLAIKYGISYKAVHTTIKSVEKAIKEYEQTRC